MWSRVTIFEAGRSLAVATTALAFAALPLARPANASATNDEPYPAMVTQAVVGATKIATGAVGFVQATRLGAQAVGALAGQGLAAAGLALGAGFAAPFLAAGGAYLVWNGLADIWNAVVENDDRSAAERGAQLIMGLVLGGYGLSLGYTGLSALASSVGALAGWAAFSGLALTIGAGTAGLLGLGVLAYFGAERYRMHRFPFNFGRSRGAKGTNVSRNSRTTAASRGESGANRSSAPTGVGTRH